MNISLVSIAHRDTVKFPFSVFSDFRAFVWNGKEQYFFSHSRSRSLSFQFWQHVFLVAIHWD